jgi:hypothetical protein
MTKPAAPVAISLSLTPEDKGHVEAFECMLDLVRDRTRSVAERYQNGCYLVGRAGTGKTHTVMETLEDINTPHTYRNARMSAMGLFEVIESHPEHTLVLDDISTLYEQKGALQILMAALGGKPGKPRTVTYTIKSDKRSFVFTGGIVAISNMPLRRDPLADAVASRCVLLEHEPTDEMMIAFMRHLSLKGFEDLDPHQCMDVVDYVISETRAGDYRLDLRYLEKGWQDYRQHLHGLARRPWKELVSSSIRRILSSEQNSMFSRNGRRAHLHTVASDLQAKHPTDKAARDKEWTDQTGLSPDQFYRYLNNR